MQTINGYLLDGPLTSRNAGTCTWGFCRKGGWNYFIKKFLAPHYPVQTEKLSEATVQRKKTQCEAFFQTKTQYYNALRRCRTGNILITEDFFRDGSDYYAVTDRVFSARNEPAVISSLDRDQKLTFLKALLFSVARFHRENLVHADLKPENILLIPTVAGYYTGKIIDFDSGYFSGENPRDVQGDPVYLAPETFLNMNGEAVPLTTKVDIFALGLLLHQYLTGELPEIGDGYQYAFEAVMNKVPLKLSPKLLAPMEEIIQSMLLEDPEKRPTAEDILRKLQPREHQTSAGRTFSVCGEL